ncbi:Protein fmp52, mitochondrial [Aspergillus melleus]|uniref:Protein fmp52, mitochondrial n=1 Tax=Aspergillus melleus TaxID=138277 RepID=A0ACC3AMJ8_9EURO|nr:Protein fmp52, mitochondrial [Aspergillus melleus]
MLLAVEVGVTGLVGSHILTTLLAQPAISAVHAYSRKKLPSKPKLTAIDNADSSTWPSIFPSDARIFFSALGTTRAQVGSFEKPTQDRPRLEPDTRTSCKERRSGSLRPDLLRANLT